MAAREVLLYPNPILKQVAAPAQADDAATVGGDLLDTMRSFERCVGLAAPQIGELSRVIAVDVSGHPKASAADNGLLVLANPRIVEADGSEVAREGCLSIPDLTANVRRATRIVDGILFLDRVESLVDDVFRRRVYADRPPEETGG